MHVAESGGDRVTITKSYSLVPDQVLDGGGGRSTRQPRAATGVRQVSRAPPHPPTPQETGSPLLPSLIR